MKIEFFGKLLNLLIFSTQKYFTEICEIETVSHKSFCLNVETIELLLKNCEEIEHNLYQNCRGRCNKREKRNGIKHKVLIK
jgi:hypothetical protein